MAPETDWKSRLRELVAQRQLTHRQVADLAGLKSETHVSTLLSDTGPHNPTINTLRAVAQGLQVSLDWLVNGVSCAAPTPVPSSAEVLRDGGSFGEVPGWAEAELEARREFREIPPEAFAAARELRGPRRPVVIDPATVSRWALVWMEQMMRDRRVAQERDEMRARLAKVQGG